MKPASSFEAQSLQITPNIYGEALTTANIITKKGKCVTLIQGGLIKLRLLNM